VPTAGAALRQAEQPWHGAGQPVQAQLDLARPGRYLLAQRDRHGVHHVGAPDLDDAVPLRRTPQEAGVKGLQRGNQAVLHGLGRSDVHYGREAVVAALAAVHMVIRVDRAAAAARLAQRLVRAVGDHLVGVHVGLGAAAGLPYRQRELGVHLARRDLRRG